MNGIEPASDGQLGQWFGMAATAVELMGEMAIVPIPAETLLQIEARLRKAERERDKAREIGIAGLAVHAARLALDYGLPDGHLLPPHYDQLAKLGARMDSFTRAAMGGKDG